jgi:hypothetical protein
MAQEGRESGQGLLYVESGGWAQAARLAGTDESEALCVEKRAANWVIC